MLIYEKIVLGVKHLFGTTANIPSDSDNQLVYQNNQGNSVSPSLDYTYLDDGKGGIIMVDSGGTETFLAVDIKDADNNLINVVPGGDYEPVELDKIEVTTNPTKTTYSQNDKLDLTGIKVTATYEDESTADVTASCTFDPEDGSTLADTGTVTVAVTFGGKSTSFEVTVE